MGKFKPLTKNEIEAANVYLRKMVRIILRFSVEPGSAAIDFDKCPKCIDHEALNTYRHRHSMGHISFAYEIPRSRLRRVIKVVKVMHALEDKPAEDGKWKQV